MCPRWCHAGRSFLFIYLFCVGGAHTPVRSNDVVVVFQSSPSAFFSMEGIFFKNLGRQLP